MKRVICKWKVREEQERKRQTMVNGRDGRRGYKLKSSIEKHKHGWERDGEWEREINYKSSQSWKKIFVFIILFIPWLFPPVTTNLFIHWNTLLSRIYQLSPPQTQLVSLSQPLSSTSMCYQTLLRPLVAHHQHPMPLRKPCQSQAFKRSLTGASEDRQLPFALPLIGGWN